MKSVFSKAKVFGSLLLWAFVMAGSTLSAFAQGPINVNNRNDSRPSRLEFILPEDGERFAIGSTVRLAAQGRDVFGVFSQVEFFANGHSLGISTNTGPTNPDFLFLWEWTNAPAGQYALGARGLDSRGNSIPAQEIRISVGGTNGSARIEITKPRLGIRFPLGVPIEIEALAVDPDSYIPQVEFYAGSTRIGVSEIAFVQAPEPGTPIEHSIIWSNAPAGEHLLAAHSTDRWGEVISRPIWIRVGEAFPVVLGVDAVDPDASEPGPHGPADPAVFLIRRLSGPTNVAVTVFYNLSGTALNRRDYEMLSGAWSLRAGQLATEIVIRPIQDNQGPEGDESVILTLREPVCAASSPTLPGCYIIGTNSSARATIRDATEATNSPPNVAITRPRDGAVFERTRPIEVRVEASDRDGAVAQLELLIDGHRVWSTNQNQFTHVWWNAPTGQHTLLGIILANRATPIRCGFWCAR